jgi:hypothetical protein
MRCPVHNRYDCECAYARRFHAAMTDPNGPEIPPAPRVDEVRINGVRSPGPVKLLALTFAGAVLACSSNPEPCTPGDLELTLHEADCLARVQAECADVPLDQPCAFEDACKSYTRKRCT